VIPSKLIVIVSINSCIFAWLDFSTLKEFLLPAKNFPVSRLHAKSVVRPKSYVSPLGFQV